MDTETRPEPQAGRPARPDGVPAAVVDEIYDELRAIARRTLKGWRAGHSLNATALVHEAWLRMEGQECFASLGRTAFASLAALSIRRILVEHYRSRRTRRRGGDMDRIPLVESVALDAGPSLDLLALDDALTALAAIEERAAKVVDLRFFGGLAMEEVAQVLGVSLRTVTSDWRYARAWLAQRLRREDTE